MVAVLIQREDGRPLWRVLRQHLDAKRAAEHFKVNATRWNYEVYADSGGNYRWRAKAGNGAIVASSGESFDSKSNAQRAADNVRDNGGSASGP